MPFAVIHGLTRAVRHRLEAHYCTTTNHTVHSNVEKIKTEEGGKGKDLRPG